MLPKGTFQGQVVLVTGGGTGIGKVIARTLGELGARVVIASRKVDVLDAAVAEFGKAGIEAHRVVTDVRDAASVDGMLAATLERFGRLDVLVNNAAGNFLAAAEDLSPNGFRNVVDIVLNGSFYCSRVAARHWFEKQQAGNIVNLIATYAWTGFPGVVHSAAAKAGVWNMTMTLAAEWGPKKVRVNAVAPGVVVTENASKNLAFDDPGVQKVIAETVPVRRLANAEEVAHAVAYLASPFASYVNGHCLTIDGGHWLPRGMTGLMDELQRKMG